jgi:membrane-associated phospholipid phosphatase
VRRWWVDGLLAAALLAVTATLTWAPVQGLDRALRDGADAHRPPLANDIAVTLNRVGSGGWLTFIAALLAAYLAGRDRSVRPFAPVLVALVLVAGVTESAKRLVHRPPPHGVDPAGVSFPSGHAVNTIVWYAVLTMLAAAWLTPVAVTVIRVVPPSIVVVTNVYLGYHWLTDMVAGVLLGLLIDRALGRLGQTRRTSTPAARNGARSASVASSSVTNV